MRMTKNGKPDKRALGNNRGIRQGSQTEWLSSMSVGERRYTELCGDIGACMRKLVPFKTRWPAEMRHMNFSCSAWTAVGKLGQCRVLVCVTREKDSSAADAFN